VATNLVVGSYELAHIFAVWIEKKLYRVISNLVPRPGNEVGLSEEMEATSSVH
jgi:hypothetical protein